jgi:hypothetical protein
LVFARIEINITDIILVYVQIQRNIISITFDKGRKSGEEEEEWRGGACRGTGKRSTVELGLREDTLWGLIKRCERCGLNIGG